MNPTTAAEDALEKFRAETKSPALERYVELMQQSLAASIAATKIGDALNLGPDAFMGGMEADLAELSSDRGSRVSGHP